MVTGYGFVYTSGYCTLMPSKSAVSENDVSTVIRIRKQTKSAAVKESRLVIVIDVRFRPLPVLLVVVLVVASVANESGPTACASPGVSTLRAAPHVTLPDVVEPKNEAQSRSTVTLGFEAP
jgi:hypothetical protein